MYTREKNTLCFTAKGIDDEEDEQCEKNWAQSFKIGKNEKK